MGWRGINIDASETNLAAFNKKRPKDINILAAISDKISEETYYSFNEGALNTLKNNYTEIEKIRNYKLKNKTKLQTSTLEMILNTHNVKEIDFLDIDIEGYDYKCLIGLNIKKFKPKVILIELRTMEENERKLTKQFLEINNYKLFVSGINTSIYIYDDYLENNSLIQ
jgi:FkbM family methyltransferase